MQTKAERRPESDRTVQNIQNGAYYVPELCDQIQGSDLVFCRKQEDHLEFLNRITAWDLSRATSGDNPIIKLPRNMNWMDIKYEWCPDGIPWIDPLKEVSANMSAVSAGFIDRDTICREVYGKRFKDIIRNLGREEQQAVDASATIAIGQPGQITTRDEEPDNIVNQANNGE